jgi:hypothetical protein
LLKPRATFESGGLGVASNPIDWLKAMVCFQLGVESFNHAATVPGNLVSGRKESVNPWETVILGQS